jgi:cysteine synthase A
MTALDGPAPGDEQPPAPAVRSPSPPPPKRVSSLRGPAAAAAGFDPARLRRAGRGRVFASIVDTIGDTPLVRLPRLSEAFSPKGEVLAKCEFFNPLSSVKDRVGAAMIEALEAEGALHAGVTLIEATSGNTGIALAFVAASKGYPLILVMPESMSIERRRMLQLLGARLELTPAAKGMRGAVLRAAELARQIPGAVMPHQFENPANPLVHRVSTGEEIWNDTGGSVDIVVSGVGTGGSITGIGQLLKARKPSVQMVALEPETSAVLSGGRAGPHKIEGIGAGFVPAVLDRSVIDRVMRVTNEESFAMARQAARLEGLAVGASSGAALSAAFRLAAEEGSRGKTIVALLPSAAERYLSTALFAGI